MEAKADEERKVSTSEGACGGPDDLQKGSAESTSPPLRLPWTKSNEEQPSKHSGEFVYGMSDATAAWCHPCKRDDERKLAKAFCTQCDEYLCCSCISSHRRFMKLKDHKLLEQDNMPKPDQLLAFRKLRTNVCSKHLKNVEFYCRNHDEVGCGDCMVLDHGSCKTELTADAAENCKLADVNQLTESRETIIKQLEQCTVEVERAPRLTDLFRLNTIARIQNLKAEAQAFLETKEQELTEEVETMCVSDDALLDCLVEKCVNMKYELHKIEPQTVVDRSPHSFIVMKQTQTKLRYIRKQIEEIRVSLGQRNIELIQDSSLYAFLVAKTPFGKIDYHTGHATEATNLTTTEIEQYEPVLVSFFQDKKECWITGIAPLSQNQIVLVDNFNCNMKLVDLEPLKVKERFSLPSRPWDVTRLEDTEIAITFPFKQIIKTYQITGYQKREKRSIRVKGECHGIDYHGHKLVVSFLDPEKVEVIDIRSGAILHRIDTDSRGKALFVRPLYVCFGERAEHIYVTEHDDFSVVKITLEHSISLTYKDIDLQCPTGITMTEAGNLVVCCKQNNSVQLLSEDLTTFQTLMVNYLIRPQTVHFLEDKNMLIFSSGSGRGFYDSYLHVMKVK